MTKFLFGQEVYGFIKPNVDAHTLGITHIAQLLKDCSITTVVAKEAAAKVLTQYENPQAASDFYEWIHANRISRIGFSYRLDPIEGCDIFTRLFYLLKNANLLSADIGPIKAVYFAGLPSACDAIQKKFGKKITVFSGDESPVESLIKLGVPRKLIPNILIQSNGYDDFRMSLGKTLIQRESYRSVRAPDRPVYSGYGTFHDQLVTRIDQAKCTNRLPVYRAHVGPYKSNRLEAVQLFLKWLRSLGNDGFLDIVSIGTSQLTQEHFGEEWSGLANGGGVPIASPQEYKDAWDAARPMLVRTYAGAKNILAQAKMYEATINMAWHALSLWWFCQIDGRGPNSVFQNLCEHLDTLSYIAHSGKPYEPNVPHHFSFRGADDITYILSAYIASKAAKISGVRCLILQIMLNTPKQTWGVQDLAKARVMLQLVRTLEDRNFKVFIQPRAGLDFLSSDPCKAMTQLASVSMLMDDIEPDDPTSPPIIHVVSYSEGYQLADPAIINESIQITKVALDAYRSLKKRGETPDMVKNEDLQQRIDHLISETKKILYIIERAVPRPYSPEGLYKIFSAGFLPVPYMWQCRDEFINAVNWQTNFVNGGVAVVDHDGKPVSAGERAERAVKNLDYIYLPVELPITYLKR